MKRFSKLMMAFATILVVQIAIQAQQTGSIAGAVTDPNGAYVPGATIVIKGESGQEFRAVTNEDGTYFIPAVQNGTYTVTVTVTGFKTSTVTNVKVDVGTPRTVDVRLELGNVGETVEIASGGEVLQTQTATVGNTITGRQITETPIASRDALDLVTLLPGTATVGAPRRSSINGLPKGALSITIDGVDVQDNYLRSGDGFFTYVRPRVDAIDEVTVTTAATGADTGGDGAVQIKFVTKRGTNDYAGSAFYQRRHESLNSNYWYNNASGTARNIMRLQQYGASFGGPIPFLKFGEDVGWFDSGKDKRYFFVNYEEFRLPETFSRTRTILTPQAQQGVFTYIATRPATLPTGCIGISATQMRCERNVLTVAGNAGFLNTIDPTVASVLASIRSAVGQGGTITPLTGTQTIFNTENYNFAPRGSTKRDFLAMRFDANMTKDHSVEFVVNRQNFGGTKDFLNSMDERFPGFPFYNQQSDRNSYSFAVRSTFARNIVNEFRVAMSRGFSQFAPTLVEDDFDYLGGYNIGMPGGATSPVSRSSFSARTSPTDDITNSMTWIKGSHTLNFGGQWKRIRLVDIVRNQFVPTVTFGLNADGGVGNPDTAVRAAFSTTTLPGATTAQLDSARAFYAALVGRITAVGQTAYLNEAGEYVLRGGQTRTDEQKTYGLFAQDSWKIRPNLTVNYGLRWQPQGAYIITSENYGKLASYEDVFGVSGVNNLFKPGVLLGKVPTVLPLAIGERAYPDDKMNFAPSAGVVWSPKFSGFLGHVFGGSGKAVLRAGYSKSFVREGLFLITSLLAANPGGNVSATRSVANGNITLGTHFRDGAANPNLTPPSFPLTPSFPITLTDTNSANAFDPDLQTGEVHSYNFSYQRELDRNTVVELRYVGNRGKNLMRQRNINELNVIENGVLAEFKLAQQNLLANAAAGRCQTGITAANCQFNIAYFGPGTGTSPLPITVAYMLGLGSAAASDPRIYGVAFNGNPTSTQISAAANFRSTTFTTSLNPVAPSPTGYGSALESNLTRRNNALTAGLPSNFFYVNPAVRASGAFVVDNSASSWYDGGVIEVRRRLSQGLRVNASYTFSKALTDSFQVDEELVASFTQREGGVALSKTVAPFDIRHAFKFDATYDLPFGRGRTFFGNANNWVNNFVGGWTIAPVVRWQSGAPVQLGGAQLVGMTVKELQDSVKLRKEANGVFWLPDDIILNSQRAFSTDLFSSTGYGSLGIPEGRFIAPAGYGNCLQAYGGQCGFRNLVFYGPSFFKFDASVIKSIALGERRSLEFRVTALDVLNSPAFRVGGFGGDVVTSGCCGSTFGRLETGSAYRDVSTTNDPGGRLIDLMIRLKF